MSIRWMRENFDCSKLLGHFDITKVTAVTGGTFDVANNTFSFDEGAATATYQYDTGDGNTVSFTIKGEDHEHTFAPEWTSDETGHWHAATCQHTDLVSDKAAHTYGDWTVTLAPTTEAESLQERSCTVCGYKQQETLAKLPPVDPKPPVDPEQPVNPEQPVTPPQPPVAPEQPVTPPQQPNTPNQPNKAEPASPQTGDASDVMLWTAMAAISGAALCAVAFCTKKKAD